METTAKDTFIADVKAKLLSHLPMKEISAIVIWGSVAVSNEVPDKKQDLDILIVQKKFRLQENPEARLFYGIETEQITINERKLDLFYVDVHYVEQAAKNGHWTVTFALEKGIILFDDGAWARLRLTCNECIPFSLSKPQEWKNQAIALLKKSRDLIDHKDWASSIIVARHATDAMVHSLIYYKLQRPPSPKTFLEDFKTITKGGPLFEFYLRIHGLSSHEMIDAMRTNLDTMDFFSRTEILLK